MRHRIQPSNQPISSTGHRTGAEWTRDPGCGDQNYYRDLMDLLEKRNSLYMGPMGERPVSERLLVVSVWYVKSLLD